MNHVRAQIRWAALSTVAAFAMLTTTTVAWSMQTPGPCGTDEHVRCAAYDANEVYRIPVRVGGATLVQLEAGEVIDGPASGLGMGYASAWTVGGKGNWVMIKPKERNPDTNLIIVTNRRRYTLALVTAERDETPVWTLSFDYPDSRAAQAEAAAKKQALVAAAAKGSAAMSTRANGNYEMRGDAALAPTAMWDDGRFTYFRYATSRDLPVIFRIMPDGGEALVNSHPDGDTVVVHETSAAFVLRLGNAVLGVRNNGYTPDGKFNSAGTTVPDAVRLSKGADQ